MGCQGSTHACSCWRWYYWTCLSCSDALTIYHVLGIFTIENQKIKTITVFAACGNARLQLDQCPSAWYIRIYNSHYPTAIPHKFLRLQEIPHKCLCLQIVALLRQDAHQHHTGHNNSCEFCQWHFQLLSMTSWSALYNCFLLTNKPPPHPTLSLPHPKAACTNVFIVTNHMTCTDQSQTLQSEKRQHKMSHQQA